jgi:hypothetical protein
MRTKVPPALLAGAAALLVVTVVAGFLLGRSGGGEKETATASNIASAGSIEVGFPDGWRRAPKPLSLPGLELDDRVDLGPASAPGGEGLAAGLTQATGSTLLPQAFVGRLPAPPRQDAVKLENVDAYRYRGLRPAGFTGRLTVYTVPTSNGVATVACAAGTGDRTGFLSRCEAATATLRLTRGRAFPLGPDKAYERRLQAAITRLGRARKAALQRLRRARTPGGQARAARAAAAAHTSAARSLRGGSPSPAARGLNAAVVARLEEVAAAYRRVAAAARRGSRGAYNRARRNVRRAEAALTRALRSPAQAG